MKEEQGGRVRMSENRARHRWLPGSALRAGVLALALGLLAPGPATAGEVIIQGSTTVASTLIAPNLATIEAQSRQKLTLVPSKSNLGLLALLEHRANLAMISTSLASEVALLKAEYPTRDFSRFQAVVIGQVRVAFAVNRQNPVRRITLADIAAVLDGRIVNWRQLGGADLPVRVVAVREGGGVLTAVEARILDGRVPHCEVVWVHLATQVYKTVSAQPGALGIGQLGLLRNAEAVELTTDGAIMQELNLVTLGEPTPDTQQVIRAIQHVAEGF
jgi:phosphate transport system substrate-binding protein